jgi:hypothetical protein
MPHLPPLPNASETAPYGVGFHPTPPPAAAPGPEARQGTTNEGALLLPALPASAAPAPVDSPRLQPQESAPSPPTASPVRKKRAKKSKSQRRSPNPSPITALRPLLPTARPVVPPPARPEDPWADPSVDSSDPSLSSDLWETESLLRSAGEILPEVAFRRRPHLRSQRQGISLARISTALSAKLAQTAQAQRTAVDNLARYTRHTSQRVLRQVGDQIPSPAEIAQRARHLGRQARESWGQSLGVTLIWLGILATSSSLGAIAFLTLSHQPPAPDCEQLSALSADMEKLYCAQQAAQSRQMEDLLAAIALVEGWSADHPLHREAQGLLTGWSRELLAIAQEKFDQSDLYGAVEIANYVPNSSPLYGDAQTAIAKWQAEWMEGDTIYQATEDAIKARNWRLANEHLSALGRLRHSFWRQQQADYLAQRILEEQQAWKVLDQAQKLAATNKLASIGEAIALVQVISPKTFVWESAQGDRERWSRALLTVGLEHWQKGNLNVAMDLIRQIPFAPDQFPEARDLILYSHAHHLAKPSQRQGWMPSVLDLWNLQVAISALKQISPDSPLYTDAQSQAANWEQQQADFLGLKTADWLASGGQPSSYLLAIEQAEQVGADRPRRVQAQTLVAHWRLEIERIEDRPILDRAYHLAGKRTIPDLQAAIAEASQVAQGRALRVEAQTSIAHWRLEIERIEDRPMLDEAIALADQGRLSEAVRAAQQIRPNRALYSEAQYLANTWQTAIRNAAIAADQKILDEAYGYASREWYSVAIDIASQIGPDRPLYSEAQGAIAHWKAARAEIWRARGQ